MYQQASPRSTRAWMILQRSLLAAACVAAFVPALNPARLSETISKNASLFSSATSYSSIGENFIRALTRGWVTQGALTTLYIGALLAGLAVLTLAAAFCLSLGKLKMQRLCLKLSFFAALGGVAGAAVLLIAYRFLAASSNPERIAPMLPTGLWVFGALFAFVLVLSVLGLKSLPKPTENDRYEIEPKYRLLLMILPFLVMVALFSYLPLWGWRYAFFDYRAGFELTRDTFVGLKWFRYLFENDATRADIVRVLKNTFAMSGIGIATSWLPMVFAIFLSEIRLNRFKRGVQTLTTIPNFISWVLVYSVAFAIFSTEGFFNSMLASLGLIENGVNHLMGNEHIWLKMWLWGTWKGLGWGAIIYIAGISGIDQQLYEAATVDGAGRFKKMWYVTVPGLMSTYFVMLLLSIANILSNGMDQYLVFYNPSNRASIQVLDLYVYQLGLGTSSGNIPLATLIGILKSVISITLLFAANKASKSIRGESIV